MTAKDNEGDKAMGGGASDAASSKSSPLPSRRRWGRRLRALGLLLVAALILGAATIGGAEYYTARPNFCGTCHIMVPYYDSWTDDVHGRKLDVACVECHYAPGEHHTVMAKFRGLSQAASYFSGRAGAGRPRAHVNDASCLTSKCHGDGAYLEETFMIGRTGTESRIIGDKEIEIERRPSVRFAHDVHLRSQNRLADTEQAIEKYTAELSAFATTEIAARIVAQAQSVAPVMERVNRMDALLKELGLEEHRGEALELMRLEHMRLRLRQLELLNCAACHTYDADGKQHFAVDQQTCFTCHFTNQAFNRDTSECLRCHEPPTRQVIVHEGPTTQSGVGPTTAPVVMDHRDIVERKIDCASCHLDVIQGAATVTVRDCTHCHDQGRYWEDFAERNTEIVAEYHRAHVAEQRARCLDCHRAVSHELIAPRRVAADPTFIQPVLNDCQHCHPSHHSEQVELLMGVGGSGTDVTMPNAMFGSRLNCRACHTQSGSDFKGGPLIEATERTCIACHSEDYGTLFQQWMAEVATRLAEAEQMMVTVGDRIKQLQDAGTPINDAVLKVFQRAKTNVQLVKAGNGVHNKNYALMLLDMSVRDLDGALLQLTGQ